MSAQPSPAAWEKEHLWLSLLALGFDAGGAAAAGKISTHLRLGVNMFDKPNKDAFRVVTWFLFSKLNQSRCNEIFRVCFLPTDKKADAEFRKQCCEWLRIISDECGNDFPPVVASLFLSPGGPKFVHLMFHFARYVLMHRIKADSSGSSVHFLEAVKSRPPDLSMAIAKYCVARNRFLQTLQKEDLLIQELEKKAQFFSKRIRELRYENADLEKQLQKMGKNVDHSQNNRAEKVEKVRCMWSLIMETLKSLEKEREVVDSVVKGHVDQYVLDGTSVAINIPRSLLEEVEKEMHKHLKFHVGNVYEAGKLNILTIIQLLNKALEMLMHECQHVGKSALKLDLQYFEVKTKFQNKTILGLKSLRQKLKREDHVLINQSIAEKQREWDLKWEDCLGQPPFHLFKDSNSVLDLLPAMSPLSFTPATEEAYKSSVFCEYPTSVPDSSKKNLQTNEFGRVGQASRNQGGSSVVTSKRIVVSSHPATKSERMQIPFEKESNTDTPKRKEYLNSQNSKYKGRNSRPAETLKKGQANVVRTPSSVKREDPLKRAQEQLAEEVADVIASDLSQNTGRKENDLEDLIGALISNPFLTRKQIPRTPENLITEIRSSWKKAIQDGESSNVEMHHSEATENMPQDAAPACKNQIDSSMACFMSSCMSDTEPPLLELQSPFSLQQVVTSPSEMLTQQATLEPMDANVCFKEGLALTAPNKLITENPESIPEIINRSVNELDCGPEEGITTKTLSPYLSWNSSMRTTLSWDASQMVTGLSSDSHEVIQLGILQEALPDEGRSISLNSSNDLEADEIPEENHARNTKTLPDCILGNECKLDFESIRSRYEALKNTAFENKGSLSSRKKIPRCRSAFSLTPVSLGSNEVFSPLGKPYASDAELVKTLSHKTLLERKATLSPIIAFSPVQQREKPVTHNQGGLFNK